MKTIIHLACTIGLAIFGNCQAQDNSIEERTRELYLTSSTVGGLFGAEYKRSLNNKWVMRYTLRDLNISSRANEPASATAFKAETFKADLEASVGLERRKSVSDRLTLIGGGNFILAGGYQLRKTHDPAVPAQQRAADTYSQGYGLSFHFGTLYSLTDHLLLGALYEPSAVYRASNIPGTFSYGYDVGFDASAVKLMLGFRWNKVKNS